MRWSGIEVKVDEDGYFNAKVDDVVIRETLYEKAKERIDKALKSRVVIKRKALRLAVLVIDEEAGKSVPAIVTGVNRTSRELLFEGKSPTRALRSVHVVADTPKNRKLASALIEAALAHGAAQKLVERLQVHEKYTYGRIDPEDYPAVVEKLEAAHAKSAKE